jgi:hypothetical protein
VLLQNTQKFFPLQNGPLCSLWFLLLLNMLHPICEYIILKFIFGHLTNACFTRCSGVAVLLCVMRPSSCAVSGVARPFGTGDE